LNSEDIVVDREHVHGRGRHPTWESDRDLRIVNTREVASTSWLVFFWLEREGVRVHTWVWAARVVVVGLHLVEVLTLLGLESVLTVEDQLEFRQWTNDFFGELLGGPAVNTGSQEWHTSTLGHWHIRVRGKAAERISFENDASATWFRSEVPQGSRGVRGRWVVEAPDKFLDWVVVGEALVLGAAGRADGIGASVLDLLDEVFVTLLREASAFLGVEVHVVRVDLEHVGAQVAVEGGRQVEVNAHFVVLKGNEWEVQTWVAVEEEDQGQVHSLTGERRGHLGPVSLLGLVQVKLGVQTPPALVVLVDALTTNGEFRGGDRLLGNPAGWVTRVGVGGSRRGLEFDVHVPDQVTVARNSDGHAARVGGGAVNSLFDVFHREVRVALVDGLEEGNLWVASQVDVLGAVGDELHETTGHCESFCTIYQDFFSG
jgi:hypothetical protein